MSISHIKQLIPWALKLSLEIRTIPKVQCIPLISNKIKIFLCYILHLWNKTCEWFDYLILLYSINMGKCFGLLLYTYEGKSEIIHKKFTHFCAWPHCSVYMVHPAFSTDLSDFHNLAFTFSGINTATQLNKYGRRHSTNRRNSLSTNDKRYCSCTSISSSIICTKEEQHAETQVLWAEDVRKLHDSDSDLMQWSIKNRPTCSKMVEQVPLIRTIRVLSTLTNEVNMEQVHGLSLDSNRVTIKVSNRLS